MRISEEEEAYGCSERNIVLHEACAKAPLEIQHHPFHPKHPLYLSLSYDSSCEGECHLLYEGLGLLPRHHHIWPRPPSLSLSLSLKMSSIQSPRHPHVLFLRNLSQHFQTAQQETRSEDEAFLQCEFCEEDLSNGSTSIYCCEKCRFYAHTSCARSSSLQIQHPRHEHPLELYRFNPFSQVLDDESGYFRYRCVEFDRGCDFELNTSDAMTTLHVEKYYCSILQEASDGESRLQFAHEHPLTTFPARRKVSCRGCKMRISEEEAYGCSECNFFLHEACAKAPLEIQHHPFHPKHPLYLSYDSSRGGECHACGSLLYESPIRYRCEECELIFDLSCVISTMPRGDDDDDGEREDISRRPSLIDHPLHPHHQLSSYHSKTRTKIECRICRDQIPSDDFFGCLDCSFFLHGSCAQPPVDAIQHYLHPEHILTFAQRPDEKGRECAVCESPVRFYCYTCQMCDLLIHPFCASATLSELEKGVALTIQLPFHEHELKLYCNVNFDFCTVCVGRIYERTLAYKCCSEGCKFKLHKSCLQLSSPLVHPSHSLHALTLCFSSPYKNTACYLCNETISRIFNFSCGECKFYLHVDCAQKPTLKHPFHEHLLFYFTSEVKNCKTVDGWQNNRKCRACHKSCGIDFFWCRQCDYTLHYECSQLPLTKKSEHHSYCDPLVLRESFIEDERAEYYCDICERRRDPKRWVYFCETCDYNFVAHVECALSPVILEAIEEDDFIRLEEEIRVLKEQVDAKEASLRPLKEELQSMRAKVDWQWVELEERKAEQAKWISMGGIEEDESIGGEEDIDSTYGKLKKLETI